MSPVQDRVFSEEFLQQTWLRCCNHRAEIEKSAICGCFYCLKTFAPNLIQDWIDDNDALCPLCEIDSVLPDIDDLELLEAMNDRFFSPEDSSPEDTGSSPGQEETTLER
jgi:hypothetical protein